MGETLEGTVARRQRGCKQQVANLLFATSLKVHWQDASPQQVHLQQAQPAGRCLPPQSHLHTRARASVAAAAAAAVARVVAAAATAAAAAAFSVRRAGSRWVVLQRKRDDV